ncbi:unnamed protein product [Cuscuta epithymum]|uniref:C2H2-type domain-containing protein n=1 Tax=Cuscuta epithymum TaxID=186058 RepID=A0AAV0FDZ9_9ASTE|nr:unnamed protein product [Cuscuta epithymum]
MPAVWVSLKKSWKCRSEVGDVHDPNGHKTLRRITAPGISSYPELSGAGTNFPRKASTSIRSGCSRSIANLKDVVIHGSKRHNETPQHLESPRSIGSSELLNPIGHEVVLDGSTYELKITATGYSAGDGGCRGGSSPFSAVTHTPRGHHFAPSRRSGVGMGSPARVGSSSSRGLSKRIGSGAGVIVARPRTRSGRKMNCGGENVGLRALTCHKCGELFSKWDAFELHHLSKHAVTQLVEGDSSRNIVEMICKSSRSNNGIERILKIHNMQKTLADFEEYRERVKIRANKLATKHARCLADGNELLRFHGTTVECPLGTNDSPSICFSDKCSVCQILRHGFTMKKEINGGVGVYTASTSSRALEAIESYDKKKVLIVCRVIAGRVHRPLENVEVLVGQHGFDSLAGNVGGGGLYSNFEELFLLDPRALLPCFVVICKP